MSPSPAAPSTASVSACASTSPSEWPARPRGWSSRTPPRTRGTPSSKACASTPRPMRRSDTAQRLRQLGERVDPDVRPLGACLQVTPRPSPEMNGDHPRGTGGNDVEVDAVAHVCDLLRLAAGLGGDAGEERRLGLAHASAVRRADAVDFETHVAEKLLARPRLVAGDPDPVAPSAQLGKAGQRVRVEVVRLVARPFRRLEVEQLE